MRPVRWQHSSHLPAPSCNMCSRPPASKWTRGRRCRQHVTRSRSSCRSPFKPSDAPAVASASASLERVASCGAPQRSDINGSGSGRFAGAGGRGSAARLRSGPRQECSADSHCSIARTAGASGRSPGPPFLSTTLALAQPAADPPPWTRRSRRPVSILASPARTAVHARQMDPGCVAAGWAPAAAIRAAGGSRGELPPVGEYGRGGDGRADTECRGVCRITFPCAPVFWSCSPDSRSH